MLKNYTKLLFCSCLALSAIFSSLTAAPLEPTQTCPLLKVIELKFLQKDALKSASALSKGNFSVDVRNDSRKVIVTHNKETAQATFPYQAYGEIEGDFVENEDLYFDYGDHFFHVDLSQKGKINIKKTLAAIEDDLMSIQDLHGITLSWTTGKTKKYTYVDIDFSYSDMSGSEGDAIDFDLESGSFEAKKFSSSNDSSEYSDEYYYYYSDSFESTHAKFRIILSSNNIYTLATFDDESSELHDTFIRSFELK